METESVCTLSEDCAAQEHEADCPKAAPAEETVPAQETEPTEETDPVEGTEPTEETEPTGETQPTDDPTPAEQVQALIDALPDADSVTAENAAALTAQMQEILELYQELDEEEQEQVDITRCLELQYALEEASRPTPLATQSVTYLDANGNSQTATATVVDANTTAWSAGWYVVNSNLTISTCITVSGDVHLILADGCTLTAAVTGSGSSAIGGINVAENVGTLTIYGQSQGTGALTATGGYNQAGIGGGENQSSGLITINGGNVTATGGHYGAAGIGGGYQGSGVSTVTINGGTITATGSDCSAGIGGAMYGSSTVTVTGGTVKATGSSYAAGIGCGYHRQQRQYRDHHRRLCDGCRRWRGFGYFHWPRRSHRLWRRSSKHHPRRGN